MITSSTSALIASVIVAEVLDLVAGHAVGRARVDVDHHPALVHDPARLGARTPRACTGWPGTGRGWPPRREIEQVMTTGSSKRLMRASAAGTSTALLGALDQLLQSLQPGLLLLGAGDPVDRRAPVPRRLALEVLAGALRQLPRRTPAAARRSARTRSCRRRSCPPRAPRRRAGRRRSSGPRPRARPSSRMLTLLQLLPVLRGVKRWQWRSSSIRLQLAVDPAEAQRLVHGLRPASWSACRWPSSRSRRAPRPRCRGARPSHSRNVLGASKKIALFAQLRHQTGITPCFFHGRSTRLVAAISKRLDHRRRASRAGR